ncbi:MAG: PfkB family carbohydrate kinase [Anaerolineaceae bacterium]|jgi:sugar/nucleoside kinase (ribokinase family)/SAM-dependent methyltransferase|nr:PfkB family carbohydrate kinase [Anaerolineaceae bacterium]
MMACGELFLSIGTVIIDDIILPNGESRMARLGGGPVHAAMGMRLWAEHVGLAVPLGVGFPDALVKELAGCFDLSGVRRRSTPTPRAWQLFETDGTRNEIVRTGFAEMQSSLTRPEEYPDAYWPAKGVHLHCAPEEVPEWAGFLREHGEPVILWEPWDPMMIPENRELFRRNAALVEVVSPNLGEGRLMTGKTDPQEVLQALLDLDAQCVALRMGEHGSLIGDADGRRVWIPALQFGPIVDVTGAGNAYCGGFVVGLARTGDLLHAGCSGAVSASFALQQFGAVYDVSDLHEEVESRFETIFANTPNPRRFAFDQMADVWDDIAAAHTNKSSKLTRIAKAGVLKSTTQVLDVGTGTGGLLPALMEDQPNSILAIDLSYAMLQKVRSNHPGIAANNVSLSVADALHIPSADKTFSVVYCHGVFPHLKEIAVALREIWRVLVPGGRLVVSHAIGRERVNAIHSRHQAAILRDDLLPTGKALAAILLENNWMVLEVEDSEDFYLVVAEKKRN